MAAKKRLNPGGDAGREFDARSFYLYDYPKTLFPLNTNRVLIEYGFSEVSDFISRIAYEAQADIRKSDVLAGDGLKGAFLPQKRVYALKQDWHLRRTVKLDPVAELFIYDFVYRNRRLFRRPTNPTRECFGYTFANGRPVEPTESYRAFKGAISDYRSEHKASISFDIASYFNSIYHHDLVRWIDELGAPDEEVIALGGFLRETNSGRSVDCLPQGLFPCKMIGNDFLKFIDNSNRQQLRRPNSLQRPSGRPSSSREECLLLL